MYRVKRQVFLAVNSQLCHHAAHCLSARPSHAANNGKVFAWDNPPETGHSDEDYNCRCWAEPYIPVLEPPIESVYPELLLLPILRVGRSAIILAAGLIRRNKPRINEGNKPENLTEHGKIRWEGRRITQEETAEAIRTAQEMGNVTTATGKYGTLQYRYRGTNGVTVIVETQGRNAGKIITYWCN